jgi:hypothetical protein
MSKRRQLRTIKRIQMCISNTFKLSPEELDELINTASMMYDFLVLENLNISIHVSHIIHNRESLQHRINHKQQRCLELASYYQ